MKEKDKKDVLICECHSTDHQLIILYGEDEDDEYKHPMCYLHIHLNKRPIWERIKYAVKYIFGYQCNYGAFDEFIFDDEDADKLQDLVNYLKKEKDGKNLLG